MMSGEEFQDLLNGNDVSGDIGGEIYIPTKEREDEDGSTLDEPVLTTLKRDIKAIFRKFIHVLLPVRSNKALLHDWDLWGPLLLCIIMAILLHGKSSDKNSSENTIHFIHVFLIVWGGAAIVTVNAQLLRGKVSFFQSVCTLGYCLLPLAIALLISRILITFCAPGFRLTILRLVFILPAMLWSSWASLGFLSDYLPKDRKILAVYPIILFYFGIGCLIIAQNHSLV